jgi:hypothetical protein
MRMNYSQADGNPAGLEQFQQKCEAALRPELHENKKIEH